MLEEYLLRRQRAGERLIIYMAVGLLYTLIFGVGGGLGLLIAWQGHHLPKSWLYSLVALGIGWLIALLLFRLIKLNLAYWFLYSIPLAGLAYICVLGLGIAHRWYLHPPTWERYLQAQAYRQEQRQNRQLATKLAHIPAPQPGLELGLLAEPHTRHLHLDGVTLADGYLWAEDRLLNQHLLLIGAPGSGKSEAIKRIISEVLSKTERDVFVVDGKGEAAFADGVQQLFASTRGVQIPVFQMGTAAEGDSYNGFVGTPEAIKQRLTAMFNIEAQMGDGEFYANINRALLNLVCLAPQGPPRSLAELDKRLSLSWLRYAYRGDADKQRALDRYEKYFDGFRLRADSLIWDFDRYLALDGFSLEGTSGAVFSLRTAAMGDTARRFLNFLIEDFKDWVGKRQRRPALLVIDEFGQFENQSIIALLELARSAELGILLATQDLSAVRERHIRERILSSVQTKLLMKTDTPELIGELAGTTKTAHLTYQTDAVDLTGLGSIRLEDQRKVDLNAVRRFPPGRAYLIRSGVGTVVQVRLLKNDAYLLSLIF